MADNPEISAHLVSTSDGIETIKVNAADGETYIVQNDTSGNGPVVVTGPDGTNSYSHK